MKSILKLFLSDFKFYRKKQGGTWYRLATPNPDSVIFWTQLPPDDDELDEGELLILDIEYHG